jgi:hypothetical protein
MDKDKMRKACFLKDAKRKSDVVSQTALALFFHKVASSIVTRYQRANMQKKSLGFKNGEQASEYTKAEVEATFLPTNRTSSVLKTIQPFSVPVSARQRRAAIGMASR